MHLHWGGGTPSILGEDWLKRITGALRDAFDLSALREHNIELDPRRITRPLVRALKEIGVNRVSLGVQDFAPHVQRAIGRVQPFGMVERSVALLREADIHQINFDLMYGLPKQSREDVARSAELALSLAPQRIALFGYAHVPWFKKHQALIRKNDLPGPRERLAQAHMAAEAFTSAGYVAVGLDHFAMPHDDLAIAVREKRLHRNFQGYTTDGADALIGLGASSIGKLPQGFVQNAPDVAGYARAVQAGRPATVKGLALNDDDRLRAEIIERLMCDLRLDLRAFGGATRFRREREALAPLANAGLLTLGSEEITITEAGRPYIRLAAAAFDAYLAANPARHSVAV
jgi:oxygen-independent coproporphyrinogen-3 oxidase